MVNISVADRRGVAVVDTGATHSIASPLLHRILVNAGVRFTETRRFVRLADGTQGWRNLLSAETEVKLVGRRVRCQFLVLPGRNVRTLLGVDFLTRAGMVIDVARRTWSFSDRPERRYNFVYTLGSSNSVDASLLHTASADDPAMRPREGKFTPARRRTPSACIVDRSPRAARDVPVSKGAAPVAARRRNKVV
uniref:SFRICE_036816 n=1 Tax=Spodoptera frugiperda TaxID=7108 RepID=A0A2H1WY77_SPOFR